MAEGILGNPPPIKPLRRIGPSQFTSLCACPLKTVWAANSNVPLLPQHPAARIGTVVHQLLEESGRGCFEAGEQDVERRWKELIYATETAMQSSWLERHLVPLSSSMHDFEVRKIKAIQRAGEIAQGKRALQEYHRHKASNDKYGYEVPVSSSDGLVRGRIDAVLPSDRGPIIRDYKSGAIFEPGFEKKRVIRKSYEAQLRMYAALYAETTGTWPGELEIAPITGPPQRVVFEKAACKSLLNKARLALEEIKETCCSAQSSQTGLQPKLAKPSPPACGTCLFRPSCQPYKESAMEEGKWPTDIWGCVANIQHLGNGQLLIGIELGQFANARVRDLSPDVSRHPALQQLGTGKEILVFNLKLTSSPTAFAESPLTVIYAK